jgi:hypothetical protein
MVITILSLIEGRCTGRKKYPPELADKIKVTSNNRYSYDYSTMIREIEEYIKESQMNLPNKLDRLLSAHTNPNTPMANASYISSHLSSIKAEGSAIHDKPEGDEGRQSTCYFKHPNESFISNPTI